MLVGRRVCHGWSLHCPPGHEDVPQQVGAIGDQSVDPEVEQVVHLVGLVDGPHVHVETCGVRTSYEGGRDDGEPSAPVGHLQRGRAGAGRAAGCGRGAEGAALTAATSGGDAEVATRPAVRARNARIRRGENDPTHTRSVGAGALDQGRERVDRRLRLEVDVEPDGRGTPRAAPPWSVRRAHRRCGPARSPRRSAWRAARAGRSPGRARRRGRPAARRRGSRARRSRGSGSRASPRAGTRRACSPGPRARRASHRRDGPSRSPSPAGPARRRGRRTRCAGSSSAPRVQYSRPWTRWSRQTTGRHHPGCYSVLWSRQARPAATGRGRSRSAHRAR